ncbi:helix-turn-helix transcriptional regulator [Streptomyces sp. NPDC059578]|uniref:helix-turn-helix transcriptional regulator n=1 Tax=Streptomyces sp. NPDC059578 TaxID=3346874 RepID=UPI0036C485E4
MPPVFAHGRLRLYLLKLLDEAPRHGYEVIRLLEERFQGLYAPSAGTVYPRLAKLETEGLVTHTTEGGRKVYSITEAGRAELASRKGELVDLELEIRESVAELAAEIRDDVRTSAGDLRRDMRAAAQQARTSGGTAGGPGFPDPSGLLDGSWGDSQAWQSAREDLKRAKQEWKEQARRAKDESRRARDEAQRARRQAKEAQTQAQQEVQRIAKRVQEQVQSHFQRGDWPTGVREGLSELVKEFGEFGQTRPTQETDPTRKTDPAPERDPAQETDPAAKPDFAAKPDLTAEVDPGTAPPEYSEAPSAFPAGYAPEWSEQTPSDDPARDLDRLLDRFRDDIRDAARDHGVTEAQFRTARRHLSTAAAHIAATLTTRTPEDRSS